MKYTGEIIIYKTKGKETQIEVKFEQETVWLTQRQMSDLFNTTPQNITVHLKNIFKEKELEEKSTCKDYLQVQMEGTREIKRKQRFYNLDAIISIGYRVNSKRGTQFRIWANKILKEYLIKGYAINEKRLKEAEQNFIDLKKTVKLLENVIEQKPLTSDEATGLLKVITDYTHALDLLDQYDHQTLKKSLKISKEKFKITYDEAVNAIKTLKEKFGGSELFGNEKDESLKSSLGNIYQTYQKKELYPGAENKAAHLLYFVVKNHSFTDGNKRIAAFLFIWFLERNGLLYTKEGFKKLEDNTLVALTLMIAESKPAEKEMMINVIINLMQKN
ncbi:MAG: virulence protein RhuM/Fic/DOC family protein [Bacteroidota bacterium]|nr:virulence protein RhuM/Fic/DOC family protein [Bacteroidota bacterium]